MCGQRFWEFISNNQELYIEIIQPLETEAKQKNEQFQKEYAKLINKFVVEFSTEFCAKDGEINWKKLVEFNSGQN